MILSIHHFKNSKNITEYSDHNYLTIEVDYLKIIFDGEKEKQFICNVLLYRYQVTM